MIETGRLVLAPPTFADLDECHLMLADETIARFIGGKVASREDAWNKLLRNLGHWQAFGFGIFTLRARTTGTYLGEVGLAHFGRGLGDLFDPYPEASWVLTPACHGKGFATEAVQAVHDWMANHREPVRTVCIIDPENTASLRVADKLGYYSFGEAQYRGATPTMFARSPPQGEA